MALGEEFQGLGPQTGSLLGLPRARGEVSCPCPVREKLQDHGEGRPWEEMGQFFAPVSLMLPPIGIPPFSLLPSKDKAGWEWQLGCRRKKH